MFIKYPLQDEADDDQKPAGAGPGEVETKDEAIDETDRGDTVSAEVAAMPEDEKVQAEKTAADEIAKAEAAAEKKAKGGSEDDKSTDKSADKPAAKAKAPSGLQVPKHRLDAVQSARRAAEARAAKAEAEIAELKALQNQAPPAATVAPAAPVTPLTEQINALDKKIDDLTEEGKADEAREVRRELRALERQEVTEAAQASAQAVANESVQQADIRVAIENVEDALPALNPDSDAYDEVLAASVNELADAFEAQGHAPAAALYKAIEYAVPTTDEETTEEDPAADPQIEKNLAAAAKLPANLNDASKTSLDSDKAGLRTGKIDVMNMSEKAFDEFTLDEDQEKIARGDFLGA